MPDTASNAAPIGRVILTYGRSLMALAIARALALRGVEVFGCDDVEGTVLSFSKHVQETFTLPAWDREPDEYLDELEKAVLTYAPRDDRPYVLMPVFREVSLIARHRDRFEPTIKVAAPRWESIAQVNPKDKLAELVSQRDLQAPRSWRPETLEELKALASSLPYPLIVKPVLGAGGRGVSRAENEDELIEQAMQLGFKSPPLVQECVDGEDYCVAVLAKKGTLKAIMAYRNLITFPREAGAGAARETVDDEPFRETTKRLLEATEWDGVAQLDFRWTGNVKDAPQLIEVNARFWAGVFHSIETGVDFPWLLFCQTIGLDPEERPHPIIGATTKTPGVWLLSAIEDVAASDPHFEAASSAWRRGLRRLGRGKAGEAMRSFRLAAKQALSIGGAVEALQERISDLKGAPSELSDDEDPMVALGALFVLSSLVRHGKLPPEVTYKAEEAAPELAKIGVVERRPRIGITKPERGDSLAFLAMKFAVWLAGGSPVKLTARAPRDPQAIDGLIFGGGADVYPVRYAGVPKPGYRYDVERGDMEKSWAAAAREHDLPVLGVCRGAQMLNVLAGGTLHPDLSPFGARPSSHFWERLTRRELIRVLPRSLLAAVCGRTEMRVNSIHSQAIGRLGAGLLVAAREQNGVIQAIEDRSRRMWMGVQFHPEYMLYRAPFRRLFRALVVEAQRRRLERAQAEEDHIEEREAEAAEEKELRDAGSILGGGAV
jgi:gamma-glutamyl-gamma-aminobutyrate hydrolase PuuD/predicted ATP-grasp superfamily ATP-dependent carboligase